MTKVQKDELKANLSQEEKLFKARTGKIVWAKKGEHLATLWDVALWLAEGNGLAADAKGCREVTKDTVVSNRISFSIFESADYCGSLVIRKWGDKEKWHEPTLEYMDLIKNKKVTHS